MVHKHLSRRQFVGTVTVAAAVGLAGCSEGGVDGGENGTGATGESPTMAGTDAPMETDETTDGEESTGEETTMEGEAASLVRAVHASPDAPNVDIYVDDEPVLTDVAFRTVSEYLELPAGSYQVRITAAGDEEAVVFDEEVTVPENVALSLVALGEFEGDTFEVRGFEDDVSEVASGESRVRVMHASPDAPAVDVAVEGEEEPLVSDLAFGEASDYATVPAGSYSLEVRPAGETDAVATFDVELASATGYSAFAMGYLDPEASGIDEPFDLTIATDTMTSEDAGTETGSATATSTAGATTTTEASTTEESSPSEETDTSTDAETTTAS